MSIVAHFVGGPRHGEDLQIPDDPLVIYFPVMHDHYPIEELEYSTIEYYRRGRVGEYVVYGYHDPIKPTASA